MPLPRATALACVLAAAGCTSAQVGSLPVTTIDPQKSAKLQFAVGIATVQSVNADSGNVNTASLLNFVETFRQANGLSAVTTDSAEITGPPAFIVGSPPYDGDGPNQIFKSLANQPALGFGFGALVSLTGNFAFNSAQQIGGPPAFPRPSTVNAAAGFQGYGEGYYLFPQPGSPVAAAAQAGTYQLTVTYPTGSDAGTTTTAALSASATLSSLTGLAPISPAPTFASDGAGGGTFAVNVPAGVTELAINVSTTSLPCYTGTNAAGRYTVVAHVVAAGLQTFVLPPNLGPLTASGVAQPTLCPSGNGNPGSTYTFSVVGFDYPWYEAAYPFSTAEAPALTGANGQADLTLSQPISGTYP